MGVKEYLPGEWRLFVDSNIRNMKCVLLYNGHEYSPVPIRQSINVREIRRNKNGFKPSEIPGILLDNLRSLKNGKFSIGTTKRLHQVTLLFVSLAQSS